MNGISVFLLVIFVLFVVQAVGGYFQVKDYLSGNIVMIACDQNGVITGGEIMEGLSFLTKFKPISEFLGKELVGTSIYEYLDEVRNFEKKRRKYYKGYIRALEALDMRFQGNTL